MLEKFRSALSFTCLLFVSLPSLQDIFEKRSRGASTEPPALTRPAEPYEGGNESLSENSAEEDNDDDDDDDDDSIA